MGTPILFLIFNRPSETARVFEAIKQAKPTKLFVAADGPREGNEKDAEACRRVRDIVTRIDWPCEVKTLFREKNLGCRKAVSEGITWFFNQVEEGIILEDDCLPDQSFFTFTSELLKNYKTDEKIMHISGSNFQFGNVRGDGSYYFSRCPAIWGWATWKRAWQHYDVDMKDLEEYTKSKKIYSLFETKKVATFWLSLFNYIKRKNIDTWDAQWAYAIMKNEGVAISPNVNLIENIGFGTNSTHTGNTEDKMHQKASYIESIIKPSTNTVNTRADTFLANTLYIKPLYVRLMNKIFKALKVR